MSGTDRVTICSLDRKGYAMDVDILNTDKYVTWHIQSAPTTLWIAEREETFFFLNSNSGI